MQFCCCLNLLWYADWFCLCFSQPHSRHVLNGPTLSILVSIMWVILERDYRSGKILKLIDSGNEWMQENLNDGTLVRLGDKEISWVDSNCKKNIWLNNKTFSPVLSSISLAAAQVLLSLLTFSIFYQWLKNQDSGRIDVLSIRQSKQKTRSRVPIHLTNWIQIQTFCRQ